jgi:antitoxin component YwqK of YwqJK toxin-antitoxin module
MSDVKKKLFIPRKIDERLVDWNKQQPVIDGVQINQYNIKTGNPTGRWGEGDIDGGDTINLFATYWDVFSDDAWDDITESTNNKEYIFNYMVKKIKEDFIDALNEDGPLGWVHFDLTLPLDSQEVRDEFEFLYNENPPITESKKLFIPRKLSGEESRWEQWNKEQPIKDGVQINQYDMNGIEQGYWEKYIRSGKYTYKCNYVDGLMDGVCVCISDDGILLHKGLYKNGEVVEYLPLKESKKLFIPRKLDGEDNRYIQWNREQVKKYGKLINQYNSDGNKEGIWEEYSPSGKLESRVGFKNGDWEGVYQTFFPNGQIQYDGQTKDDEFNGLWRHFYINGDLNSEGYYVYGKMNGIWKGYHPFNENQLEYIANYVNGKVDGLYIEYFGDGNIKRKDLYNMDKKIAYIVYNRKGGVDESMNWKDEYDNIVIKEQIEDKDDILKSWGNYYGSDDTANWELDSYESEVEDLIENGGNIYRVLFVDNLSEINLKDMGNHWTTSRDNVIDVAEINQQYYGKNKQKVIVIEGYVEPNSITIEGVDVKGNPHEKEVNIINGKDVKIKQIFEYVGRKFIPIDMNINEQMEDKENILKSFEPKKELNPKVWDEDGKLKKKIKDTLVAIGQEFHKSLEVEAPIEDIIFTGSLANYNWSQYSDVDLHVLIDFNEFDDKELIKKYFDAKKAVWNDNHNIKIKGYDVELYAQDKDEPHESTGIYSVMNDEWIKKPKPQDVKIDRETIKKKVRQFESEYNRIVELYKEEKYVETRNALDKLKDKIKKYRKAGLDKGGEMATENLVFKTMRRSGLIEKIYQLGLETTDKEYTIETIDESETPKKKLFIPRKLEGEGSRWSEWNNKQPVVDGNRINQYDVNGKKQGIWIDYYWESGKLSSEGNYKDDRKDGDWKFYWRNGNLMYDANFKNNEPYGEWLEFYDDGSPFQKIKFKDGIMVEEQPLTESNNINEGKLSDNIDDTLKNFKKNFGLDVGFLASFGAGINGLIKNMGSLIKEYTTQPLSKFEITNLAIAMIVVYLRKNKSLKDFKDEMLSIVAFTSLMPGYNDMVNSLLGNVDFMEAFTTIIKSLGVYTMLNHFKSK